MFLSSILCILSDEEPKFRLPQNSLTLELFAALARLPLSCHENSLSSASSEQYRKPRILAFLQTLSEVLGAMWFGLSEAV